MLMHAHMPMQCRSIYLGSGIPGVPILDVVCFALGDDIRIDLQWEVNAALVLNFDAQLEAGR